MAATAGVFQLVNMVVAAHPHDPVALVAYSGEGIVLQPWTTDTALLAKSLFGGEVGDVTALDAGLEVQVFFSCALFRILCPCPAPFLMPAE